jgi:hypothetical protein
VRNAFIRFARWARTEFQFPIRLPVYLGKRETVRTRTGHEVSAIFFAPRSRHVEPFVRVATGDYSRLRAEMGRNNALAVTIHSLCHELVHYRQWWEKRKMTERGVELRATWILKKYLSNGRLP